MDGFKGLAYRSNIFGVVASMDKDMVAAQLFKNICRDMFDKVTGDRILYSAQTGVQSVHNTQVFFNHIQQLHTYYTIV